MSGLDISLDDAVTRYVERKAVGDPDGPGAGTYASNAGSILRRWTEALESDREVRTLAELDPDDLRWYARDLDARADRGEYAASTARTYFAVVRAFLSWCVAEGALDANPATAAAVDDELPTPDTRDGDRDGGRSWPPEARRALESFVRERAAESDDDRVARLREYALVAMVANTGLRGAELFRVPEDDRRSGATWGDVDFYAGTIRVLGTSQRLEDVPIPAAARTPLRRYRVALDPPTNEWPVFPTRHAPSIASRVRSALADRGLGDDEIDEALASKTAIEVARSRSIAPPAITTEGARSILRRLCERAEVDVDGDYLTPRGARDDLDPASRPRTDASDATEATGALEPDTRERSLVAFERGETLPEAAESAEAPEGGGTEETPESGETAEAAETDQDD